MSLLFWFYFTSFFFENSMDLLYPFLLNALLSLFDVLYLFLNHISLSFLANFTSKNFPLFSTIFFCFSLFGNVCRQSVLLLTASIRKTHQKFYQKSQILAKITTENTYFNFFQKLNDELIFLLWHIFPCIKPVSQ